MFAKQFSAIYLNALPALAVKANDLLPQIVGLTIPRTRNSVSVMTAGGKIISDDNGFDAMASEIEPELRAIAARRLRAEYNCSLEPEDLVNEVMVRLLKAGGSPSDRARILGYSAHIARQALVDHARRKAAEKRNHERVTLLTTMPEYQRVDVLEVNAALTRLNEIDPDRAALVEMRFFGGMTMSEIAQVQAISLSTAKRRWEAARLWLEQYLAA